MKIFIHIFLLSVLLPAAISCKKDKDSIPPKINIVSPLQNNSFKVLDTIKASAVVTDETKIVSTTVQLVTENMTFAAGAKNLSAARKSNTVEADYILSDTKLTSGIYYLKFSASDGLNNTKEFVKIFISEAETKLTGLVLFSTPSTNLMEISILNNNDELSPFATANGIYIASCVSSKDQSINLLSEISPGLNSYRYPDKILQWNIPAVGAYPYFTNMNFFEGISYVCYKDGSISGFDKNGNQQYASNSTSGYLPIKSFLHNDNLLVVEDEISGTGKRLGVYYNTGALKHALTLNLFVVEISKKDDGSVLLFGNNDKGKGEVQVYSVNNNDSWIPYEIANGTINSAVQVNSNMYLLAFEDGVYKYSYSPASLGQFVQLASVEKLAYDEINNTVYCLAGNSILGYNFSSGQLIRSYTHSSQLRDFHLLYNR